MKKLIFILSLSFMLAGEMEVDGDLNVSGDIQSPTIAQLQEIIAQLQAQNGDSSIQSKIYQLTFEGEHNHWLSSENLSILTGVSNSWYLIDLLFYETETISGSSSYSGDFSVEAGDIANPNYSYGSCTIITGNGGTWKVQSCERLMVNEENPYVYYHHNGWLNNNNIARTTLTVLVTTDYSAQARTQK